MDNRRRSYTASNKRVTRKHFKRGFREFKRGWQPSLTMAGQGPHYRIDGPPQSILQKLRYTGTGALVTSAIAGNEQSIVYPLDPNAIASLLAPTGHQPTGWDQWQTLYSQARVRASRVRITFQANPATSNNNSIFFASTVLVPGASSGLVQYVDVAQDPRSKSGVGHSIGSGVTVHKHYNTLQMLAGAVDPTDDAYTITGTSAAPLFGSVVMIVRNGNNPQSMNGTYQIDIKFYMEFFAPINVPRST
uniref:Uncharacterized protein n=1 Tax=uncultured prokaryote TaxID=198431 RepID=A0A0H5Q7Q1_9ZZZZ|nr:hypothetical protein [uncultured prokaryote]